MNSFYSDGYNPTNPPTQMTAYDNGSLSVPSTNPKGFLFLPPPSSTSAVFEIDALVSFIPSINMFLSFGVAVFKRPFDATPAAQYAYNERAFTPTNTVTTWSVSKMIITVPLLVDGALCNNVVLLVQTRTDDLIFPFQKVVYGVGNGFGNQYQIYVRRIL